MTDGRCAELSEAAGESLAATATTAESWLLVEVPGTWPRDVADEGGLDSEARAAASAWLARTPSSRLLFIRRPGKPRDRRLVFVVRAAEHETEVRRFELEASSGVADVDLDRGGARTRAPLVLVCGHGTRDACCALRGTAVYGALESHLDDDELWLSSHQGGHRFAANVLILPGGIQLGRVSPDDAIRVVGEALVGRVSLDHFRGRTAYTQRQQAAERAVREAEGFASLGELRIAGDDGTHVSFVGPDGTRRRALVEEVPGPVVPASCGVTPAAQASVRATLV